MKDCSYCGYNQKEKSGRHYCAWHDCHIDGFGTDNPCNDN